MDIYDKVPCGTHWQSMAKCPDAHCIVFSSSAGFPQRHVGRRLPLAMNYVNLSQALDQHSP